MSKAIITKYHGPTNYRGSRVSASDSDGNRVYVSYNYGLKDELIHKEALDAFLEKMNWPKGEKWAFGHIKEGLVWVNVDDSILPPKDEK